MRTDPRPNNKSIGRFYPEDYGPYRDTRFDADRDTPPETRWKKLVHSILAPDTRRVPRLEPGRMLEVGCASGAFLTQMARMGWDVSGIEFSETAGRAARALEHRVHIGSLDTAPAPDPAHGYDLVVAWMVLEHLPDPVQALRRLADWSRPGAWLALSVPDAGSLEFRVFRNAWYALDLPRHLFHFTRHTLGAVLGVGGWRVRRVLWHSNPNNLLQSMLNVCLDRGFAKTAEGLQRVIAGERVPRLRLLLGRMLGLMHESGRMTVWAQRDDDRVA
jgi:SAM-dependent methyltransferase